MLYALFYVFASDGYDVGMGVRCVPRFGKLYIVFKEKVHIS